MAQPLIAVVDHEPVFLRLMQTMLTVAGYRAMTINDGAMAYELIKRDQPQAVIIDSWLGAREDGWDLLQVLKLDKSTASIPVIVLSSDDPTVVKDRLGSAASGADVPLLFKPFDPDDLLAVVAETLEQYHA